MHSGSVTASGGNENEPSKRQKFSEGQDMISNLPDFIIGHILSFLRTKYAVRTSALSHRWRHMWTFVTKLSFYDQMDYSPFRQTRKTCFMNYVCRVLFQLNSASIQEFHLSISENCDPFLINESISAVLNRRVKNICVRSLSLQECYISSYPLFKCQSLEKLVLIMNCCIIPVTTFVCFSSLTVLSLSGVTFTCYSSNESKELTLNFPVLREYEQRGCTWPGVKSVTIEALLLEVVSIRYLFSPSVESHAEIKIRASHLTKYNYFGSITSETILLDAHIASAEIVLCNSEVKSVQEIGIFVHKLFSINAECLQLHSRVHQDLVRVEHYLADIPAFGMLRHLQLDLVAGEVLWGLLSKSPCLETLVLKELVFAEGTLNFAIVPQCFLSTLKVVKFETFAGDEHELGFAKFVMENAQVKVALNLAESGLHLTRKEAFMIVRHVRYGPAKKSAKKLHKKLQDAAHMAVKAEEGDVELLTANSSDSIEYENQSSPTMLENRYKRAADEEEARNNAQVPPAVTENRYKRAETRNRFQQTQPNTGPGIRDADRRAPSNLNRSRHVLVDVNPRIENTRQPFSRESR